MKKFWKKKKQVFISALFLIVLILAGLLLYILWVKPSMEGLVVLGENQGYNKGVILSVASLMQQAASCQPVPVTFGNSTIHMIAVECLQ